MTRTPKTKKLLRTSEYFGIHCFDQKAMAKKLTSSDLKQMSKVMKFGGKIDADMSNRIAKAARDWALEHGAAHYCHWFQPQTGITAEKHESFLWFNSKQDPIEKFTGSELLQSESDASSFPSGGKRSTFEARGYTAWDPSSPMFIWGRESQGSSGEVPFNDKTLYIPTVFVSYHGEALDFKTPLLRSNDIISRQATKTLQLLGHAHITHVSNMIGAEQEFFIIDKNLFSKRTDLKFSGRSVFGKRPPKGQELEDHYFGHIPSRVQAFMNELEIELHKLGVPLKTRHNEVAPGQFEVAPIFEPSNIAADHNQLLMKVMKDISLRHNLVVLLHEKPFANVNGSGKHVNWSLADSSGKNLLDPGHTPAENLVFLTFLNAVLLGIHDHADVLRASIASAGNDHRLGANEAPPAIISAFLGEELNRILNALEAGTNSKKNVNKLLIDLNVSHLQDLTKDNTDRNRTSPFAFTGNKFEFRAVGSSASISYPITILNGAVASGLAKINAMLEKTLSPRGSTTGSSLHPAVKPRDDRVVSSKNLMEILKTLITQTKKVRFEGNGYSQEWADEAKSRGLSNFQNTPAALNVLSQPRGLDPSGNVTSTQFLIECGIFNKEDIESRLVIQQERYIKECLIELNCALEMAQTQVLPCALNYYKSLLKTQNLARELGTTFGGDAFLNTLGKLLSKLFEDIQNLQISVDQVSEGLHHIPLENLSHAICNTHLPRLAQLRAVVDALEAILPKDQWPYPTYADMVFEI